MSEGIFAIARIIAAIITGVLGPFVIWWLKERYDEEEDDPKVSDEKNTVDQEVKFAQNIAKELESIREELEAGRTWIAQFHNGGKLLNSVRDASMKRVSVTHEVTAAGVSKEQRTFSEVLVSFFSEMIDRLIQNDYVTYKGNQVDVDPEVELLFRQRGTEQMYLFAMRNIDGVLIGILGVDYTAREESLNEQEVQYLKAKASLLAGYIFYGSTTDQK